MHYSNMQDCLGFWWRLSHLLHSLARVTCLPLRINMPLKKSLSLPSCLLNITFNFHSNKLLRKEPGKGVGKPTATHWEVLPGKRDSNLPCSEMLLIFVVLLLLKGDFLIRTYLWALQHFFSYRSPLLLCLLFPTTTYEHVHPTMDLCTEIQKVVRNDTTV